MAVAIVSWLSFGIGSSARECRASGGPREWYLGEGTATAKKVLTALPPSVRPTIAWLLLVKQALHCTAVK